ncbi:hypothetical protein [uncultured Sphingomonas sp.]|uniref:hypothetical protein n=1 Tax=uncultured Sphingomonas sp. TaxID=158754 RepID=UPI0025CC0DE2|nr:hypothetical protein [uncultured Sphingomonas sp.]
MMSTAQDEFSASTVTGEWALGLVGAWVGKPNEIHKRPPFRAHSFDADDRYWVVGSTSVSVLHGWHGDQATAQALANALNAAALASTDGPEQSAEGGQHEHDA